jgi:hypothetical protein
LALAGAEAVDDLGQWFHYIPLEKNSAEEHPEISRGKSIDIHRFFLDGSIGPLSKNGGE